MVADERPPRQLMMPLYDLADMFSGFYGRCPSRREASKKIAHDVRLKTPATTTAAGWSGGFEQ